MIKVRKIKQTKLKISKSAFSQQVKGGIKTTTTARKYAGVIDCNPLLLD